MDPDQVRLLRETYRLSQENNKMLRKMRRQQLWSSVISWIIWGALLLAPIWLYMTYLSGPVNQIFEAAGAMQQRGQDAQNQYESLKDAWQQLQARFQDHATTSQQQ